MRYFNEVTYEAVLDEQIQQIANLRIDYGAEINTFLARTNGVAPVLPDTIYSKMLRRREYEYSKIARPFFMQIQFTFTGVAGQTFTAQTPQQNNDLILVAASTNAPTTGLAVSLRDTYTQRSFQNRLVPVTAHFANVANNTERYFRFPGSPKVGANSSLELTVTATAVVDQTVTFSFMFIWPQRSMRSNEPDEQALDRYVYGQIDRNDVWTSPLDLVMDVDFTGIGAGLPVPGPALTAKNEEPVLVYALQHNLAPKADILTAGPLVQLQTNDISFNWSPTPELIWTVANYVGEPEQWISLPKPILVRPYTQIAGFFTNGTGGAILTGPGQVIFLGKRL